MALVELPVVLGIEVPDGAEDSERDAFFIAEEILADSDERLIFAKAQFSRFVISRDECSSHRSPATT